MLQSPATKAHAIAGMRDIHLPAQPSWWPPAPGWWLLAGLVAIGLGWLGLRGLRFLHQRRRVRAILHEFDRAVAAVANPSLALAEASALLRRAARQHAPSTTQLEGDAWLVYLDGSDPARPFTRGAGRALVDALFTRSADAQQATAAIRLARSRLCEMLVVSTHA